MVKFIIVISYFLCHFQYTIAECTKGDVSVPTHDCANELEKVFPINLQLGDFVQLVSPYLCHSGEYITDHFDHQTGQYRIIGGYRTTINITKFEDGGIYRFYCNGSSSYCYLEINVLPDTVQMTTSEAIVNQSFNATCLATGYPPPKVYITLDCQPNNIFTMPQSLQIDNYTTKAVISVNEFPARCSAIYCYSYPISCAETINYTVVTNPNDMEHTNITNNNATTNITTNITDTTTITTDTTNTVVVPTSTPAGAAIKATNNNIIIILLIPTILLL